MVVWLKPTDPVMSTQKTSTPRPAASDPEKSKKAPTTFWPGRPLLYHVLSPGCASLELNSAGYADCTGYAEYAGYLRCLR